MDDFERAIRVIFTQDPSIGAAANAYCDGIKARPDGWRICWDRFSQTDALEVKFWCAQVILQAMGSMAPEARLELRTKVLGWLGEVVPNTQQEVVVKNKVALIYVGLARLDYPASWATAWQDLMGLMDKGLPLVDFFLRVLAIFDQEVISDEVQRSQEDRQRSHQIKHAMRERDVVALVECWYRILTTLRTSAPQMVSDCLRVASLYIVWIEILTVANDKFLSAVCSIIAEASASASEACECLAAIISKKMPAGKKMMMLSELRVCARLEACVQKGGTSQQLLKEAEMLNSIAEAVLEAYVDLRVQDAQSASAAQVAWDSISALMPLIFWFFVHQEHQIAVCLEPFLTEFFVKVKSFVKGAERQEMETAPCHSVSLEQVRPILMQTLQLIIQRTAYPAWFQHHDPNIEDDEQHALFIRFRKSLAKIYKRIFLVDEQLGLQFVQASTAQLTQNLAGVQPMEVDAVLYLFKETGEIVKQLDQHLQAKGPLASAFVQLVECEALVNADHWAVQLALMEVYVRYGRLLALHPDLFPRYGQRVLQAFVSRGIRSSNAHVVSRACFMFGRFMKLVKAQAAPLVAQIQEALQDLLVVQYVPSALVPVQAEVSLTKVAIKGSLKADDQAYLFEALANLATASKPEELRPKLEMLLKGPAQNLTEILGNRAPGNDVAGCAGWAGRNIEAIATVSKPFTVQHASTAPAWEEVLVVVARILEKFVNQMSREIGLWRAALFLCRRMVEVLGDRFLEILDTYLPFLYATNDQEGPSGERAEDLAELTVFAHQLVCQYQQKTGPYLQKWLPQIFLRPFVVWQQLPEQSEQLKREKLELSSALLQLLKEAALRCPGAILEPMLGNTRHGQEIIGFLLVGLQDARELKPLQYAANAWAALLAAMSAESAAAITAFPMAQLLQRLLWSVVRMDYSDFQSQKVLNEASSILHSVMNRTQPQVHLQQTKETFQQALVSALPGLRSEAAPRRLCEVLSQDCSVKDVRTALQQCALDWRRECG
ncbi:unnamed protein product [Effrenium voratum]|uniref:Exportin-T n=1 Tax=Effrenium voratum TaxID=2562239 RepID=A0AA36MN94_9DINO|nr:unnamed protein product [Effrenium voratum]